MFIYSTVSPVFCSLLSSVPDLAARGFNRLFEDPGRAAQGLLIIATILLLLLLGYASVFSSDDAPRGLQQALGTCVLLFLALRSSHAAPQVFAMIAIAARGKSHGFGLAPARPNPVDCTAWRWARDRWRAKRRRCGWKRRTFRRATVIPSSRA